ncbi:amino acid ABC transporter substrate-binding protein, PAAT family [Nakamurella panacisegetis]|uniref:Amino acid ABC transporter substrate-binding protein, PAAT family n=1 Tax=Nakamurella panacisegetis TaxID=1090615 RepID=A0A1H0HE36_9ACTN|nr:ABC transporter substrate-binding protein [Nakamurella panacisegetis]SDO17304.1 amino acid ABC transporter substrate-binding protein, PAAT family [Nakamurella panacisegetis]
MTRPIGSIVRRTGAAVALSLTAVLVAACGSSSTSTAASSDTSAPVAASLAAISAVAAPASPAASISAGPSSAQASAAPGSAAAVPAVTTQTPGTLLVGTVSDGKPNAYLENNQWKGFDLDLITAIAKDIGLKVEFRAIDFSALFPAVSSGRFDIGAASSAGTVERQKIVGFSKGYLIGYLGVLTKKTSGITNAASTAGKRIGLLQGSIQEAYAKRDFPKATVVEFPDSNSGVAALESGTIDGYFLDYVAGQPYTKQHTDLVEPISVPAFDLPAAFPIAKSNTGLIAAVNAAMVTEVKNGTYLRLYKQYFPGIPVPGQLPPYALPTS